MSEQKEVIKTKYRAQVKLRAVIASLLDVSEPQSKLDRIIRADVLREELEKIYDYIDKQVW